MSGASGRTPAARGAAALLLAVAGFVSAVPVRAAAPAPDRIPEALPGAPPLPAPLRAELARALAARGPDYVPRTRHRRPDGSPLYSNRLLLESSPYLLQHAHNPVNWYPWGDAAFAAAARLGRPVLVSIGYSTCHWCHVMEEESFDHPETAALLNAHFVAVKVDREARPDVDAIYMEALHAMGEQGGWPLNVWVTPERKPFYGGTYFPPQDGFGRRGFGSVLRAIHDAYARDPGRVVEVAGELAALVKRRLEVVAADATWVPDAAALRAAAAFYAERHDERWGGLRGRPKFPSSLPVRTLLRYHRRSGDARALEVAALALEKMAAGGIYDHVGGGFHRYSTDERWLVPHFEKMLYDNALLAQAYLEGWQATGRAEFARIARDVLRYLEREMTSPEGAFYSATDADSRRPDGESEEGWFFTWTPAEIDQALGPERGRAVRAWYGVSDAGNAEGRSILHAWRALDDVAAELEMQPAALEALLDAAREPLYEARRRRPPPLRDEKILAAWNGLVISAFARAGFAFDEPRYVQAAARAADFVLRRMRSDGRLHRVFLDGRASGPAFLEDYAFLIEGLLHLYEAEPEPRWLREAVSLQALLDAHYADTAGGGYFQTSDDHEVLLAREKPSRDGAVPSGNSVAALGLLRLAEFTGEARYRESAVMLFSAFHPLLTRAPSALSEMLLALDYHLDTAKEIVVVAPEERGALGAMLAPLRSAFVPNRILAVATEGESLAVHAALVPLLHGKVARGGRVTAYVCENRVCSFPTSEPGVFAEQIASVKRLDP